MQAMNSEQIEEWRRGNRLMQNQAAIGTIHHQRELTPDLEEQWQKRVMPIALDGLTLATFEGSQEGLREAQERLRTNMPIWAVHLRHILIEGVVEAHNSYLPVFVLRAETAAAGIYLLNPCITQSPSGQPVAPLCGEFIYRRIAFRFLTEAMMPLAPYLNRLVSSRSPERLRVLSQDADTVMDVLKLCQRSPALGIERSADAWSRLRLIGEDDPRSEAWLSQDDLALRDSINLACTCRGIALRLLRSYTEWWAVDEPPSRMIRLSSHLSQVVLYLNKLYDSAYGDSGSYHERIAAALLTALEAECPPPDWLPRI